MESMDVQASSGQEAWKRKGTCDARLYDALSSYVATPAFLKAFVQQQSSSTAKQQHPLLRQHSHTSAPSPAGSSSQQQAHPNSSSSESGDTKSIRADGQRGSSPSPATSEGGHGTTVSEQDSENQSSDAETQQQQEPSYVFVQQEDAVQAMAFYLAQCIATHPEAQNMEPRQLQDALSNTLQNLKQTRFKRFKRMWTFGRSAYQWGALTYSALQMYQNPWLIRAVLTTIWAFSKLGMRAFV